MSEFDASRSPMRNNEAQQLNSNNDTLDDAAGSANNSIIGRVKSRVTSIFPNSLSKWFSPSTRNDSLNGNMSSTNRRRRRVDDEAEEDDDDIEDFEEELEEEDIADSDQRQRHSAYDANSLGNEQDENSDEESNNSDEETTNATSSNTTTRRLNSKPFANQPPTKRARLNFDITDVRDSPLVARQPLIASTPAISTNLGSSVTNPPPALAGRAYNRYKHSNLYGGHHSKKPPAYNFLATNAGETQYELNNTGDISDLVPVQLGDPKTQGGASSSFGLSSRRSLNIPSTLPNTTDRFTGLSNLKRQSLSSVKPDTPYNSPSLGRANIINNNPSMPRRTSTRIIEMGAGTGNEGDVQNTILEESAEDIDAEANHETATTYNGESILFMPNKRQKFINGVEDNADATLNTAVNLGDSASESSDGGGGQCKIETASSATTQRKTGLFNMTTLNNRNGSRNSSMGNGLNFYSHLEGRKSLFSGYQGGAGNAMNNSTLSLNSLNRRQFNASIYGSTSALSDSRLLNTFSPFYKGKTTYGGASAYNKYGTSSGTSAVRITPTLMRPTSSLSTLSSSSNSVAAGANLGGENSSAISSTAKRILDLINDFATPLSEAKKMASNLRTNQHHLPQGKSRLSDADLQATRAMRLSQVRTPYMRPSVTLHPNANGPTGNLPPVRELQVPSMSQLLQMKKLQNTTERSRKIATQNSHNTVQSAEYALPIDRESGGDCKQQQQQQQKHSFKIKNKIFSSIRNTGLKDANASGDDIPEVELPNITFPHMDSIPKIDIHLPISPSEASKGVPKIGFKFSTPDTNAAVTTPVSRNAGIPFKTTSNVVKQPVDSPINSALKDKSVVMSTTNTSANVTNFKFAAPLELKGLSKSAQNIMPVSGNYKFSPPTLVALETDDVTASNLTKPIQQPVQTAPKLKTGSVLDVLKKPFTPSTTATSVAVSASASTIVPKSSFGNQFQKSSSEWECDTCMIRNKDGETKCVACETPRKQKAPAVSTTVVAPQPALTSSFGSQLKKSANEWECDGCWTRNKEEKTKCVACETPRKSVSSGSTPLATTTSLSSSKNSFGDVFKHKTNTWECPTCLIVNKKESNNCVACETKQPGGSNTTVAAANPTVKFGFGPTSTADGGFKLLAAEQKSAKWECEACMTRNDSARRKCVCCEQAKPGTQAVSDEVPKFSFGSTAAAKFNFGFGTATNAPKEEELRNANKASAITSSATTTTTVKTEAVPKILPTPASGGFQFGFTPAAKIATEVSKDIADAASKATATTTSASSTTTTFQLAATQTSKATVPVSSGPEKGASVVAGAMAAPNKSADCKLASPASSAPSVKFALPSTIITAGSTNVDNKATVASTTFSFGSPSSTTNKNIKSDSGSNFRIEPQSTTGTNKTLGGDTAALGGFSFKAPAISTTAATSSTNTFSFGTAAVAAATTKAPPAPATAGKAQFSFGFPSTATTSSTGNASATTTAATIALTTKSSGMSFGSSVTPSPSTAKTGFSPSTSSASAPSPKAAAPAATNIFGSFMNSVDSTSANFLDAAMKGNSTSGITANVPTFGTFGASTTLSGGVFGSFGSQNSPKLTTAAPSIFSSSTASATTASAAPIMFGSSTGAVSSSNSTNPAAASTTTTWSKDNFVFGGAPASIPSIAPGSSDANKSVFGSFGIVQPPASITVSSNPAPSIFGNLTATTTSTAFGGTSVTTGTNANVGSSSIFGSNNESALGAANANVSTNLFGVAPSGNANTPTPTFGVSPFGNTGSTSSAPLAFGTTAAVAPTTFGGFGLASGSTDGASAAKKTEPPPFNFGATAAATTNTQAPSGPFNFGSSTPIAKPAFNFAVPATSQPTFNFTGTAEQQQMQTQTSKPFQFGSAPVFNFIGGGGGGGAAAAAAVEATPNAPFQFSAGAPPAPSNIFAPSPTPSAQTAQQARRKVRAPIRRLTPR